VDGLDGVKKGGLKLLQELVPVLFSRVVVYDGVVGGTGNEKFSTVTKGLATES
jgi:hypothetical protein